MMNCVRLSYTTARTSGLINTYCQLPSRCTGNPVATSPSWEDSYSWTLGSSFRLHYVWTSCLNYTMVTKGLRGPEPDPGSQSGGLGSVNRSMIWWRNAPSVPGRRATEGNHWFLHLCPTVLGKDWIGLDLFNNDTHPSGYISRPSHVGVSHICLSSTKRSGGVGYMAIHIRCSIHEVKKKVQFSDCSSEGLYRMSDHS